MPRGWNESRLFRGKLLTDKKIKEYQERGFYDTGFKSPRRETAELKRKWLAKHGI